MKVLLSFLLLFITSISALADTVEIEIHPKVPVMNEVFKIVFKVSSETGTDPVIQFNPRGIEILSKEQTGISTQTTYINGNLTVKREINIAYEAIANRSGVAYLDNIITNINGTKIRSQNININISRTAQRAQDIFVEAEASKSTVFVNESVLIRYYLYHKVPIRSTDVKKFPDLAKFLKRYHQESTSGERVTYQGEIYTRRVIYTAQVFAQSPGAYKVDPISLDVAYSSGRGNLGLGFGYGQMRSKAVRSKPIEITVLSLPVEDVPPSFTGLVGKHSFKLRINKNQFVANEPIEIELKVRGQGALELLEAPNLLDNPSIEQFEVNSDLVVNSDFTAEKTFSYTFLGRQELDLKDLNFPLSYFDSDDNKYKTEYLKIGDLRIVETSQSRASNNKPLVKEAPAVSESPVYDRQNVERLQDKALAPIYTLKNTFKLNQNTITYSLGVILLILLGIQFPNWIRYFRKEKTGLAKYKKELSYQEFNELMINLFESGDYIREIKQSKLEKTDQESLIGLINRNADEYMIKKKALKIKIPPKLFLSLENMMNENNK